MNLSISFTILRASQKYPEKPPQEFYEIMKELLHFRKDIKTIKDLSRYTKELDTKRVEKTLKEIDELRLRITEKYIK